MPDRSRRTARLAVVVAAAALVAAACSSGGSTGTPSGPTLTGDPIKFGIITNVAGPVDFADTVAAVRGAALGVNNRGGIGGRPLQIVVCNESLDPNKARACARQMQSEGVVATVGNNVVTAEKDVDQILSAANIANVGGYSYGASDADPNSYPLFGGQNYANGAQIVYGTQAAGKTVGWARLDSPLTAGWTPFYEKAYAQLGATLATTVTFPQVSGDMSTQAAALIQARPDFVNVNGSGPAIIGLVKSLKQLGYQGKVATTDSSFSEKDMSALGANTSMMLWVSPFPPVAVADQYPGMKQFLADMDAEKAAGDKDAPVSRAHIRSLTTNGYFAVIAAAEIANQGKATDAASFKKAISSAKNIDLGGVIPPWTPGKSVSKGVPRASNGDFYFYTNAGGDVLLVSPKPVDVTPTIDAGFGA